MLALRDAGREGIRGTLALRDLVGVKGQVASARIKALEDGGPSGGRTPGEGPYILPN